MLISFIIPVYNVAAHMLLDCIESILALPLNADEREIIVVDDGSAQPVKALLNDHCIRCVRTPHQGVAAARNTALEMAQGHYVQFIDADDMLLTTPYTHILGLVKTLTADIVMFEFTHSANKPGLRWTVSKATSGTTLMSTQNIHGAVWSYIFKRGLCENIRFRKGVNYAEDEEFTALLMLKAQSVVRTSAPAYFYRQHAASAISRSTTQKQLQRIDDNRKVIVRLKSHCDALPPDSRKALKRRVAQLTMDHIYNIIVLTRSRSCLQQQLDYLRQEGLFPLPHGEYTTKYKYFRHMTRNALGRRLLLWLLPLMHKER